MELYLLLVFRVVDVVNVADVMVWLAEKQAPGLQTPYTSRCLNFDLISYYLVFKMKLESITQQIESCGAREKVKPDGWMQLGFIDSRITRRYHVKKKRLHSALSLDIEHATFNNDNSYDFFLYIVL